MSGPSSSRYTTLTNVPVANTSILTGSAPYSNSSSTESIKLFDTQGRQYHLPSHFQAMQENIPMESLYRQENYYGHSSLSTSPQAEKVQPTQPNGPTLYASLKKSLNAGALDMLQAGRAIQEAYAQKDSSVSTTISLFVKQVAGLVRDFDFPEELDPFNPTEISALTFANCLMTKISHVSNRVTSSQVKDIENKSVFDQMTACTAYVKGDYKYPGGDMFSDTPFDLTNLYRGPGASHVKLKKDLFTLLGQSCKNPKDIQEFFWAVEGYDPVLTGPQKLIFPKKLYFSLRDCMLEMYGISDNRLDGEYLADLPCLDSYDGPTGAKKRRFRQLALARKNFLEIVFHTQFRNALTELRHAEYRPPSDNKSLGIFVLRKRNEGKRARVPGV